MQREDVEYQTETSSDQCRRHHYAVMFGVKTVSIYVNEYGSASVMLYKSNRPPLMP